MTSTLPAGRLQPSTAVILINSSQKTPAAALMHGGMKGEKMEGCLKEG